MQDIDGTYSNKGGRITAFHLLIIGLSLTLTLAAWQYSIRQVETRTASRFEAARDQTLGLITDRMKRYEDGLWAGVAAVESHGGAISYENWRTFARNLGIEERYPGINGIGVIHYHSADTLGPFLSDQRMARPDFRVHPVHDQPEKMPITYIEPEAINAAAVGLDVAHEVNRRTAALASRDTGTAQITGPIVLVQDAERTSGFLFYAPFYAGGRQSDIVARRENFRGTVYAPFVVHKLMEGLLAKDLRSVRFSIRDAGQLIYDEHGDADPGLDPDPMFAEEVALDLYGRNWVIDMRTDLGFRAENASTKPTIILLAGLFIETLIVALIFLMSRANGRAIAYADRVTQALRAERAKLVATNEELSAKNEEVERFAYVASHDLKTPIRGINGLTDMVEEDLEDYFASPAANPDVKTNLERIHDRIRRMEDLTSGIMALSRISSADRDATPVRLGDMVNELIVDFGLRDHQVVLTGGSELIRCDPGSFHSVLENLVGNAIKHHRTADALRIDVTASATDDRLRVSVADNGPGIDPAFHARIFEVFQTLRSEGTPDSTGIGLAIVRKAVEQHGGTVTLVSAPGEGASFGFDWPLRAGSNLPSDDIARAA